jgi:ribonuclease G
MADDIRILVRDSGVRRRVALLDGNRLAEYYVESDADSTLVNALYLGRVERVVPGMNAAFVSIGQPLNAFLPLDEMTSFTQNTEGKPLAAGAEIIVQVKKDPKDEKGAFVTRDVTVPGQYLLYMPLNRHVGVSKRVTDEGERELLKTLGAELSGGAFGLVMRGAAASARREAIVEELAELQAQWVGIKKKATFVKAPATLHRDVSVLAGLVRDYAARYTLGVTCNDTVSRMPAPPTGLMWEQVSDTEMEARFTAARVEAQLAEALGRRVSIKNGGALVIDEREALTTIDVNSASFVGDREGDLAFRLNLAVCDDIARQIRLRNVSGIILIDFIDMKNDEQRTQVMERLAGELSRERVKTVLHGFTSLGLLEMTRKRTGPSLREQLKTPCEKCGGTGYRLERDRKA